MIGHAEMQSEPVEQLFQTQPYPCPARDQSIPVEFSSAHYLNHTFQLYDFVFETCALPMSVSIRLFVFFSLLIICQAFSVQRVALVVRISKEGMRKLWRTMAGVINLQAKKVLVFDTIVVCSEVDQSPVTLRNLKLANEFRIRFRDIQLIPPHFLRFRVKIENAV